MQNTDVYVGSIPTRQSKYNRPEYLVRIWVVHGLSLWADRELILGKAKLITQTI